MAAREFYRLLHLQSFPALKLLRRADYVSKQETLQLACSKSFGVFSSTPTPTS